MRGAALRAVTGACGRQRARSRRGACVCVCGLKQMGDSVCSGKRRKTAHQHDQAEMLPSYSRQPHHYLSQDAGKQRPIQQVTDTGLLCPRSEPHTRGGKASSEGERWLCCPQTGAAGEGARQTACSPARCWRYKYIFIFIYVCLSQEVHFLLHLQSPCVQSSNNYSLNRFLLATILIINSSFRVTVMISKPFDYSLLNMNMKQHECRAKQLLNRFCCQLFC